jgi:hypothetical protein
VDDTERRGPRDDAERAVIGMAMSFVPPVPLIHYAPGQTGPSDPYTELTQGSGLTAETLELARIWIDGTLGDRWPALAEMFGLRHWYGQTSIIFPFFEPGAAKPYGYRCKPGRPRLTKGKKQKPIKYIQRAGTDSMVYFPPRSVLADAYRDNTRTLYWTEGEKKSLLIDQLGEACLGLTGVWNWTDPAAADSGGGTRLHPLILKHVTIAGRRHVICFDADARANTHVMDAARKLAGALYANGAAAVLFVCPPTAAADSTTPAPKGIDDYYVAHGETATRALLAAAEPLDAAPVKVAPLSAASFAALDGAELPAALVIPPAYEIDRDGAVWVSNADGGPDEPPKLVSDSPIMIKRKLIDLYTGACRFEMRFNTANGWQTVSIGRETAGDRVLCAALRPFGAMLTAAHVTAVVQWLHDLERENADTIERVTCVSRAGWHLVGNDWRFVTDTMIEPDGMPADAPRVVVDQHAEQRALFTALRPLECASFDAHIAALRSAWEAADECAVMICAAFAAPLLRRLGLPNFAVHLCGDSSRGKTSMLKCAASVYADPDLAAWVASWNATAAGLERRAAALCDLPQCYDEAGLSDPKAVEQAVYALINGAGRQRSTKDLQLRETLQWHTVVLSTGETEIAGDEAATGAQVRVISLPVGGFGELGAAEVDGVREACRANAGAAGARWLRDLAGWAAEDWAEASIGFRELRDELRATLDGDALAGRVAGYFGLLAFVEAQLADWGIGDAAGETMRRAFANLRSGGEDGGGRVQPARVRVLEALAEWVASAPNSFPHRHASLEHVHIVNGYRLDDDVVAFMPLLLAAELRRRALPWTRALRAELTRTGEIVVPETGRNRNHQVVVAGQRLRLTVIKLGRFL